MPLYEYHCENCETEFEELVSLGTPEEDIACPACGQHRARRLLSVFCGQTRGGDSAAASCGPGGSGFS